MPSASHLSPSWQCFAPRKLHLEIRCADSEEFGRKGWFGLKLVVWHKGWFVAVFENLRGRVSIGDNWWRITWFAAS